MEINAFNLVLPKKTEYITMSLFGTKIVLLRIYDKNWKRFLRIFKDRNSKMTSSFLFIDRWFKASSLCIYIKGFNIFIGICIYTNISILEKYE